MDSETDSMIDRVARHAALADPARLRITDLLVLGDRSPGELKADLGIGSNLLAHHLGVLERAQLITRARSEGDRRRSYVRLLTGSLPDLRPAPTVGAQRVVFVCTGNSARSPLAAAVWTRMSPVPATSAGTEPAAHTSAEAIATAERHGLELTAHVPRPVEGVLSDGDVLVTVCDRAHEALGELETASSLHWSVPNPRRMGTPEAYDVAYNDIARRAQSLALHLTAA